MVKITCKPILNLHHNLGECPVWDEREEALYWIDGLGCRWFCKKDEKILEHETQSPIGSMVLTVEGGIIAALQDGIYKIDPHTGAQTLFANPEVGQKNNRFNDGKADPVGRYVVGTMSEAFNAGEADGKPTGSLYSLEPDGKYQKLLGGISISNGLAWNSKKDTLYYVNSPTRTVMAYDYDLATGGIRNGRICIRIPEGEGIPDGMTIDEENRLWIAQWGGWCVSRFDPETGERLAQIDVPVEHVTCCAFGGRDMDQLFITTSTTGVVGCEWLRQPLAGAIFVARPGVRGLPAWRFGEEEVSHDS
ncbi:MAG: SMP-30/gluconolactonase/LRE family protein [Christensenellales bacterium]|jgi:sugar lactone lactonase YvrE